MRDCRIGIFHNQPVPPGQDFSEASIDVLTQVEAIERALADFQCPSVRIPFTKDVGAVLARLAEEKAEAIINLCESVDEDPQYVGHPAAVLELLGIPFSGSSSLALMLTTDKLISKRLLLAEGIKTPHYAGYEGKKIPALDGLKYPVIVKPRLQDASIGIDQDSVFRDESALRGKIEEMFRQHGPLLIEEYVHGREFNISLLGFPEPAVLPIAEINFVEYPPELFPIVGYRAKWDTSSFEYRHSTRSFPALSDSLREKLEAAAVGCFHLFELRDYARIDARVDEREQVYVLEANANPCLSPDAGFAAAAEQHGLNYASLIEGLLQFMKKRTA